MHQKKEKTLDCRKAFRTFKVLFKKTLCSRREKRTKRNEQLQWTLQTKSWLCHCANSALRLFQLVMSVGAWYEPKKDCLDTELGQEEEDCVGTYN